MSDLKTKVLRTFVALHIFMQGVIILAGAGLWACFGLFAGSLVAWFNFRWMCQDALKIVLLAGDEERARKVGFSATSFRFLVFCGAVFLLLSFGLPPQYVLLGVCSFQISLVLSQLRHTRKAGEAV